MNEQVVQMVPMWILAGLSAGWLAETWMSRRGYGLIVDLGVGVGAGLVGGGGVAALSGPPVGMLTAFAAAFVLAATAILVQRLGWPCVPGSEERRTRLRLGELRGHGRTGRPTPTRALARVATTGIYLMRGVPLELQRAARVRAASEGTTLRVVLLKGLGEYAAGTWTPELDDERPVALAASVPATGG